VPGNFCPFIHGPCRDDCVFKANKMLVRREYYDCLIAIKLCDINEFEHDDLVHLADCVNGRP
jgi:hypothetical protein